jgi:hypothetical protein
VVKIQVRTGTTFTATSRSGIRRAALGPTPAPSSKAHVQ